MARLGNILMLIGLAGFLTATAWWLSFFHDILGDNFQIARDCFYWTANFCTPARAAAIFADVPAYDPWLLWVSVGVFFVGVFLRIPGPPRG